MQQPQRPQQQQQQQQQLETLPTTDRASQHPATTAVNLGLAAHVQVLPTQQPPPVQQLTAPPSPVPHRVAGYSLAGALASLEEPVRKKPRLAEGEVDLWVAEFLRLEKWLQVNVPTKIAERAQAIPSIQQMGYNERMESLEQFLRTVQ